MKSEGGSLMLLFWSKRIRRDGQWLRAWVVVDVMQECNAASGITSDVSAAEAFEEALSCLMETPSYRMSRPDDIEFLREYCAEGRAWYDSYKQKLIKQRGLDTQPEWVRRSANLGMPAWVTGGEYGVLT